MLSSNNSHPFRPLFLDLNIVEDKEHYTRLISNSALNVFDTIIDQIKELVKLRIPNRRLTPAEYQEETNRILNGQHPDNYGIWVYYEWSNTLVHTLKKDEFIEVRTSRNQYKITKRERDLLAEKKIGIVGLSVGSSIAMTLATERVCGELRLADFDTLELSNLNRLRTGIHNLGIPKVIIAAREIAEIDPYIELVLFKDGLTDENIDAFFGTPDNQLDILVEVCDGIDMKIVSRYKAKQLRIPVVMDTNDRGMVDIERFDLEPDRPILHGLAGELNPASIKGLTNEQKIPYILKMVGAESISTRLKASMIEVEQTLNTWPQLASSVQLGGAATTDVCRRILLNELSVSGRFYIDLDELIADQTKQPAASAQPSNPFNPLSAEAVRELASGYIQSAPLTSAPLTLSEEVMDELMKIAIIAPSAGNNQPWKWYHNSGRLLLFHDRFRSWSWGDYNEMGALMGLGTALESVSLYALKLGYKAQIQYVHSEKFPSLIADIIFEPVQESQKPSDTQLLLANNLIHRHTNRSDGTGAPIANSIIENISRELNPYSFVYLSDKAGLDQMGHLLAACDRLRLLHPQGHEEFFHEIRWDQSEALRTRDGIEIASAELSESDKAGFRVAKDYNAIQYLYDWNLGQAFTKLSTKSMNTASGFGIVSVPEFTKEHLLKAGGHILRAWTTANLNGVGFYPMLSLSFFFNRLKHGNGLGLPPQYIEDLKRLYTQYEQLVPGNEYPVFMFRLAISNAKALKTFRMEKQDIYIT